MFLEEWRYLLKVEFWLYFIFCVCRCSFFGIGWVFFIILLGKQWFFVVKVRINMDLCEGLWFVYLKERLGMCQDSWEVLLEGFRRCQSSGDSFLEIQQNVGDFLENDVRFQGFGGLG